MATGFDVVAKNATCDLIATNASWLALYTDSACTIEVSGGSYTRKQITTWGASSNGVKNFTGTYDFTGLPASCTVAGQGLFTLQTGGVRWSYDDLTASETFANAGGTFKSGGFQITTA